MKKKQNKVRRSNRAKYFAGFTVIACLAFSCLIAEEQKTTIQNEKTSNGMQVIKVKHVPGPDNLVQCWSTMDLEYWDLDNLFLGSDGPIEMDIFVDDPDVAKIKFWRFNEKSLVEAKKDDTDWDGFDDVYEVMHQDEGMDPLVPDFVEVASVSVSKEAIAAGAIESEPHQTEVTLEVSPPRKCPVQVWLCSEVVGGAQHSPAKITWNDQVCFVGGEESIEVMTDADGLATLQLTSSNMIGESCVVHARAGTIYKPDSQAESAPVQFEQGVLTLSVPASRLTGGSTTTAEIQLTYGGAPLPGHEVALFVNKARIYGIDQEMDTANPDALNDYITILGDSFMHTDEAGKCSFEVLVAEFEGLDRVRLTAKNESQFFGE